MSLVKSLSEALSPFFKPEVRKQGEDFIKKNLVVISVGSDTLIEGYVKGSLSARVSFRAESIEDENFYVDCNCSSSSKGQFCKHIWAMLLLIENKHPDFLSSKSNIEKKIVTEDPKKAAFKEKQSDYKKQQYEKQKLRNKSIRAEKKKKEKSLDQPEYDEDVKQALKFFAENGFPFEVPFEEAALKNARKKLSRVFHPDIGGSHQETVDLNVNYDILFQFMDF